MVDSSTLTLSVGIVVISVLLLTFLLYTRQLLKRKSHQLRLELDDRPEAKGDRAFNQIRIATTEAELLERGGVEVEHARELLSSAQRAYDRHDWDSALREARSAHESLVALRAKAPRRLPYVGSARPPIGSWPVTTTGSSAAVSVMPTVMAAVPPGGPGPMGRAADGSDPGADDADAGSARLPKNRAEAHFQLTLLSEDVERTRSEPGGTASAAEADQIRAESQAAYARGDYTEALRLALRGRRRIGSRLETLPPSRSTQGEASPPKGPGSAAPERGAATSASTCPRCGKGVRSSDKFCRGCGTTLVAPGCPRCGQPVQPDDAFCAGCGAPVAP